MRFIPRTKESIEARIEQVTESGCWIWVGAIRPDGYGQLGPSGSPDQYAHRVSYRLYRGPIPEGLDIDHRCRVRCCVNPWHMEAVSRATNVMRGESAPARHARQTHCKKGHPFSPENTRRHGKAQSRQCITCYNAWQKRYRAARSTEITCQA